MNNWMDENWLAITLGSKGKEDERRDWNYVMSVFTVARLDYSKARELFLEIVGLEDASKPVQAKTQIICLQMSWVKKK